LPWAQSTPKQAKGGSRPKVCCRLSQRQSAYCG
jgi:hypothetical protein